MGIDLTDTTDLEEENRLDETTKHRGITVTMRPHPVSKLTPADFKTIKLSPLRIPAQLMEMGAALKGKGFIAGGYARHILHPAYSPEPADIDIFSYRADMVFDPEGEGEDTKWIANSPLLADLYGLDYEQTRSTPNAVELVMPKGRGWPGVKCKKLQCIYPFDNEWMKTYGSAVDVLSLFDFTVAMVAIEFIGPEQIKPPEGASELAWKLSKTRALGTLATSTGVWATYHKDFRKHNRKHRLYINHINCPIAVSMRMTKMAAKGYFIGPREIIKLFKEWETRSPAYKERLTQLTDKDELSPTEWFELEKLLRID